MHAAVIATTVTTPVTKPYRLFVNGEDVLTGSASGVPIESLEWENTGTSGPATLRADHWDPAKAFSLPAHAEVRLWDQVADEDLFGGYLLGREAGPAFATGRIVQLRATDYSLELDRNLVTKIRYPAGLSDRAIIQGLLGNFLKGTLVSSSAYIAETNTAMPAMEFEMQSLRSALDQVTIAANGDGLGPRFVWVDPKFRAVRYARVRPLGAPYVITDNPTAGDERAPSDLKLTYDDSGIVNAVYVKGKNARGSGWVSYGASVALYGWRGDVLDVPDSRTRAMKAAYGQSYLSLRANPVRRGSFSITGTVGWKADQAVTITSSALGLSSELFDIKRVRIRVLTGTPTFQHEVEFGALKPALVRGNAVIIRRDNVGGGEFNRR